MNRRSLIPFFGALISFGIAVAGGRPTFAGDNPLIGKWTIDMKGMPFGEISEVFMRISGDVPTLEFTADGMIAPGRPKKLIKRYEVLTDRVLLHAPDGGEPATVMLVDATTVRLESVEGGKKAIVLLHRFDPAMFSTDAMIKRLSSDPMLGAWEEVADHRTVVFYPTGAWTDSKQHPVGTNGWDRVAADKLMLIVGGMPASVRASTEGEVVTLTPVDSKLKVLRLKRSAQPPFPEAKATPASHLPIPDIALKQRSGACAARKACFELCINASANGATGAAREKLPATLQCRQACGDPRHSDC